MDPPVDGMGLQPEKLEEEKEGGPSFHCDLCDADIVYKIAQSFLPGLASACIDNTTGGLFKTPADVAVDIRKEMVDYLIQRSENFVAESVVLEGGPDVEASIDPYDVISDFVDDFGSLKRNFFSRVSGWLLSDRREDWIDDFVQEIELNGFWVLNRRNAVAQTLLKNLDFKNIYHCNMNFKSLEDLEKHKSDCSFRTMMCSNEGCDSSFSAAQMDHHDSVCPFKMLQCEQNCPDIIMRREMDRHCITTCPMKLVRCPFHSIGCQSTVPQCTIEQHRTESLSDHLLYVLQVLHKEASPDDLKERVIELEKLSSPGRLESARDARSLSFAIKDLEAKLGLIKIKTNAKCGEEEDKQSVDKNAKCEEENKEAVDKNAKRVEEEDEKSVGKNAKCDVEDEELVDKNANCDEEEDKELIDKKEEKTEKPPKHVRFEELPSQNDSAVESHSNSCSDHEGSSNRNGEMGSPTTSSAPLQTNQKDVDASISVQQQNLEESPVQRQGEDIGSPPERRFNVKQMGKPSEEEVADPLKEENSMPPVKPDNFTEKETISESTDENEVFTKSPHVKNEMSIDSSPGEVSSSVATTVESEMSPPVKNETSIDSPPGEVSSSATTTVEREMSSESPPEKEERLESVKSEVSKESNLGKEETDELNRTGS